MSIEILSESQDIKIQLAFQKLIDNCCDFLKEDDLHKIKEAFKLSLFSHGTLKRPSGELYILHKINVATIVAKEMNLGVTSIICSLLHDIGKYTEIDLEKIEKDFGPNVRSILDGITKIDKLTIQKVSLHADNYIKLVMNLSMDVRSILVKLADRLDNMRKLGKTSPAHQLRISHEVAHIYAPIAHRLGLYNIKTELEELTLKYIDPAVYKTISKKLVDTKEEREHYIREFTSPLNKALSEHQIKFSIKGRSKAISSIWGKMKKQNVDYSEVYDVFAIRIIIESQQANEKEECWKVYSIVTDMYPPNPKRLRDWISSPKSGGYESLHTTVMGPHGKWVEVQIRTKRMDEIAEMGQAAHWKYKAGGHGESTKWLSAIIEVLQNPSPDAFNNERDAKMELYSNDIFAFTPKGDLIKLGSGATLLDFAFTVHSSVGATCTGGKVNGKIVTLKHLLKNGDQVEILTSKNQKPKADWLKIVSSPRAKAKIRRALSEEKHKDAEAGKELLQRKLSQSKILFNDDNIVKLLKHYKYKNSLDLYQGIGSGSLDVNEVKSLLIAKPIAVKPAESDPQVNELPQKDSLRKTVILDNMIIINNDSAMRDYKLAKCCSPVFGDKIFGFVTVSKGITIHRESCPNALQMKQRYAYRVLDAYWNTHKSEDAYISAIKVSGKDQMGVVNELSKLISSDFKVNMRSFSMKSDNGAFEGLIEVYINDSNHLEILLRRITKVKGVERAIRMTS